MSDPTEGHAGSLHDQLAPKEPFTTRELAQEMLLWFERDIPETVVRALKIILSRYIETGVYTDDMEIMLGYTPKPKLAVQRFIDEATADLHCAINRASGYLATGQIHAAEDTLNIAALTGRRAD